MFRGEYFHNIDAKGRLNVPAKLRDALGDTFVVTKGLESSKCLFVYSLEEWKNIEDKYTQSPHTDKNSRQFARFFFGSAADCEVDKQGRFLLPPALRTYAGLEKEVVLAGVFNRIEIWNREAWERENEFDDFDAVIESVAALGVEI